MTLTDAMFSSPDACRIVGVTARQVKYWVGCKIVAPTHRGTGTGCPHHWTGDDLRVLAAVKLLFSTRAATGGHDGGFSSRPLPVNWDFLGRLVRANESGWLVVDLADDGWSGVTPDPAEAVRWALSCACAATVNLSDLPYACPARGRSDSGPRVPSTRGSTIAPTIVHPGPRTAGVA